jgi:trans-2,3-dihydro-3-hydroxyanthranilate isomerase
LSSDRPATSTSTAERPYTLLDVFTDVPLAGNPLAVVLDAEAVDEAQMLAFARETRLSETTFVQSATVAEADYRNRIFSMAGELPFAGHPSLGTAVAFARSRGVTRSAGFVQQTGAGLQQVEVESDDAHWKASMLQEPARFGDELAPAPLLEALGLDATCGHPELAPQRVSTGLPHVLVPLAAPELLARIRADAPAIDELLTAHGGYGLYAAWCEPQSGRARARLFTRGAQADEDPATGSAAGPLCAYLHSRTGCRSLEIAQGVEMGRPSRLRAEIDGERVRVSGDVVVVIDGVVRL